MSSSLRWKRERHRPDTGAALKSRGDRKSLVREPKPALAADQSAALRDRLLAELDNLKSVDEATTWAHRSLGAKNTLAAIDARLIEQRFGERLSAFGEGHSNSGLQSGRRKSRLSLRLE
jgi:hypothetical protein